MTYELPDDWCEGMTDIIDNRKNEEASKGSDAALLPKELRRPRILNYAIAGRLSGEIEETKEYAPVNPLIPDYDCTIIIRGDSMEPTYHSGDEIALRDVTKTGFIQWGMPHVMDTSQGIVLKRLYQDQADNRASSTFTN